MTYVYIIIDHVSTISGNILNTNQNSFSTLDIRYISYFYHVFPLHPNTFHQLFQHSTQPQLYQLKTLITKFNELNGVVIWSEISFYASIGYLGRIAYVVLAHILYLLTSILQFNALEIYYTLSVQLNLILIMNNIKKMLLKSWHYLHDLMNKLIKKFCVIINGIFLLIKAKLLYYLHVLHTSIVVDYVYLLFDVEDFIKLLSKLQLLVAKYKLILETVKELLKDVNKLVTPVLANFSSIFSPFTKVVCKLLCKFKSISSSCDKVNGIFGLLNQQLSSLVINVDGSSNNITLTWKEISHNKVTASIMNIDLSKNTSIQNLYRYIKKILKMIEIGDIFNILVSVGIVSMVGKLYIIEQINLRKFHGLIKEIQLLYYIILIRAHLLVCTVEFYTDVANKVLELSKLMKFECFNCNGFLLKCSEVEKYIGNLSKSIDECIEKLAKSLNGCKLLGLRPVLLQDYVNMIGRILLMKFYVDLIAREILIFKNIILTLIPMCCSSQILDSLMFYIASIGKDDNAIGTLIECYWYLQTFYFIQLENTLLIFGLSSRLMFSESIHQYYGVLLLNLYLINGLIWGIECYIHHLIVFKYTSEGLNAIYPHVLEQFNVITEIKNVLKAMATITDKLSLVSNSINQLNQIQSGMNILNWKQSATKIRQETQSINTNLTQINSQITEINKNRDEIIKSWATLLSLEYFLNSLISQVMVFIKITDNRYNMGLGIGNKYYAGVILSVMEPFNKQLKFIFLYLVDMWFNLVKLIKIVQNTILMIYVKMGFLYGLTSKLKEYVNKIDKGVVDVECAIEGVARNFIQCSTEQLSTHLINCYSRYHNRIVKDKIKII